MDSLKELLGTKGDHKMKALVFIENISKVLSSLIGINITPKQITYSSGVVKVKASSVVKSEIYLHKDEILQAINNTKPIFKVRDIY